jgi:hypothetical protein
LVFLFACIYFLSPPLSVFPSFLLFFPFFTFSFFGLPQQIYSILSMTYKQIISSVLLYNSELIIIKQSYVLHLSYRRNTAHLYNIRTIFSIRQ